MTVRQHVPKVRYGLAALDQVQQEVLQTAYRGTAFGWVHEGKSYMLTAGRCTSLNKPASNHNGTMGTVTAGNWNNNTGSVKWNGQSYYSGDVSTIKMSSGKASSRRLTAVARIPASPAWCASAVGRPARCAAGRSFPRTTDCCATPPKSTATGACT